MKTKAKNQLRLAGDPVIGVDVTAKGDWVLVEQFVGKIAKKALDLQGFFWLLFQHNQYIFLTSNKR